MPDIGVMDFIKFQFNFCTIKRENAQKELSMAQKFQFNFCTIKSFFCFFIACLIALFQFNFCTIKRRNDSRFFACSWRFQFNFCTIKRMVGEIWF